MIEKLKSRKLWITILAAIVGALKPELLPLLKILIPTYVAGQSAVDLAGALKAK